MKNRMKITIILLAILLISILLSFFGIFDFDINFDLKNLLFPKPEYNVNYPL